MKSAAVFFLLFASAFARINGGLDFPAKESAKNEVRVKHEKVKINIREVIDKTIRDEKEKIKDEMKIKFIEKGTVTMNEAQVTFQEEGIIALKMAIEKNKPLSAYECVVKVTIDGRKTINDILHDYKDQINKVEKNRMSELDNFKLLADLINFGLEKTLADTYIRIEKAKNPMEIESEKAKGLKKCASADSQTDNLRQKILSIKNIEGVYTDVEKAMKTKYESTNKNLRSALQRCVS